MPIDIDCILDYSYRYSWWFKGALCDAIMTAHYDSLLLALCRASAGQFALRCNPLQLAR